MRILGTPLGWIMHACYSFVQNYGLALILFTLLTRLVLLPMAINQQKSMVKMAMFRPKMEEIQRKYAKNPAKMNEELSNLYAREGYNPLTGCLPMLIQFPILFGLIDVIYNPLTHLLKMDKEVIARAIEIAQSVLGAGGMSQYSQQMSVLGAVKQAPEAFAELGTGFTQAIANFDFTFFGLDMSVVPGFALNIFLLIPIISGLSSFAISWMSKKNSAAPQDNASTAATMNMMLVLMPLMSAWIAFQVPAGVGIYWILSNLFMLVQQFVLNKFYNPQEQAAKAQAELEAQREAERLERQEARRQAKERRAEKDRQRAAIAAENKKRRPNQRVELPEEDEDEDESGLTQKEINRRKLAAARKRDAEKYGEEYVEVQDGDLD